MQPSRQPSRELISVVVVDESVEPPLESKLRLPPQMVEAVWQVQFNNPQQELSQEEWNLLLEHGETLYEVALQQMQLAQESTLH